MCDDKNSTVYDCTIRTLQREEWTDAMDLAWRTFMEFEAADYTEEGIENFRRFIRDDKLHELFVLGMYEVYAAYVDDRLVGMISLRSGNHISLLFVDREYHKCGIGTALIDYLELQLRQRKKYHTMTVDAAPYGLLFYHKLGFCDTEREQDTDGIKYTPMERDIDE
jgi:ribosomal protein S18 acetylase RimI-like enzyme